MKSTFKLREQLNFYFFSDKHNVDCVRGKDFHKLCYEKQIVKIRDSAEGILIFFHFFNCF